MKGPRFLVHSRSEDSGLLEPAWDGASPVPGSKFCWRHVCEGGSHCTTEGFNTHKTKTREVRYGWHPWQGRQVAVRGVRTRSGLKGLSCTLDDDRGFPVLEIPEWMFDAAVCGRFARAFFLYCTCNRTILPDPAGRRLRKLREDEWMEYFREVLPARGLEIPPEPELRGPVKRGFRVGRRFIRKHGRITAHKNHDLLQERMENCIIRRCPKSKV